MAYFGQLGIRDGANLDAFSRLRVSAPAFLFDAQFTYDLQPYQFEQITNGTGAAIAHDATNRHALMTFSSTPTGGKAFMQSYLWCPYQPGRGQLAFVTFNFNGGVANVLKFAGMGDGANGMQLEMNGTTLQASLYSDTTNGDQTVTQANFNLDKLDGTGRSGYTFDATKTQILVVDYQALYVGRVRLGLDIDGVVYYFHEFRHANRVANPYIQIASLPVRCGMTCTGTVSTTMWFVCSAVLSEGGNIDEPGFPFTVEGTGTAGNGSAAHILSLRPKATFNSLVNRAHPHFDTLEVLNLSNTFPARVDVVIGQAISGTTAFNSVNAASVTEYNTLGTISGAAAVVLESFYVEAAKQSAGRVINPKFPITLDAAGAVRANGTLSVIATGIGGAADIRASLNWNEVR